MRQIVLDTETTGLEVSQQHRIIEIGCVELIDRKLTGRTYHQYIQPDREIDQGAIEVHGISNESLVDKPRFAEISDDFIEFVKGSQLVIHNAPFDIGFLNAEFALAGTGTIDDLCEVLDTLALARRMHPGQKNNLDALCNRYSVDNSNREFHGALLDARILAEVYLAMTGGQTSLSLSGESEEGVQGREQIRRLPADRPPLKVIRASEEEIAAHTRQLDDIDTASNGACLWLRQGGAPALEGEAQRSEEN